MLATLKSKCAQGKLVVVFGAGEIGKKVIDILRTNDITVYGVCDNDESKQKKMFCGYNVLAADALQDINPIVIVATMYFKEIIKQLKELGIESIVIYKELYLTKRNKYEKLIFPKFSNPQVSIVMTAFNEWNYTYECLKSILSVKTDIKYEVIIGDDLSSDETKEAERYVENITVIHNKQNLGYLRNCNETAKHVKGKYMIMLATDVKVVSDYWLDKWVKEFEKDETVGVAGGICFDWDLTTKHYGWSIGANVTYLENSVEREQDNIHDVDYLCPACICIRMDVWREIGGYDKRFVPAWYEDLDFYCETRKHDYRVVLDIGVQYIHYGNVSYGVVPSRSAVCQQNHQKFMDKWSNAWEYVCRRPNSKKQMKVLENKFD